MARGCDHAKRIVWSLGFQPLELGLRKKLLEPGVIHLQLSQPSSLLGIHAYILL